MCNNPIHVHQCAFIISLRCTLKCKLCLAYAPYYKNPINYSLPEIQRSIDTYFQLIDTHGIFNVQGGEPLMHPDLPAIMTKVAEYKAKIGKILLTTNGTLLPSPDLLRVLSHHKDYMQVNISDYGPTLSKKVPDLINILEENKIPYHIFTYHGDQMRFGGWLDFTDHTLKYHSEEDLIATASECGCRNGGNLAIRGGELFSCCRAFRRIDLGIVEKTELSCVDMFQDTPIEKKRENLRNLLSAKYTPACAYCVGKRSGAIHHPPAEQLTEEELKMGVEKI